MIFLKKIAQSTNKKYKKEENNFSFMLLIVLNFRYYLIGTWRNFQLHFWGEDKKEEILKETKN